MTQREEPNVSKLAKRFQAAIDQEAAAKRIAEEQTLREREQLEQARRNLLDTLAAFGQGVSWFEVERVEGSVVLRFGERSLSFESVGGRGKIKVEGDGLGGVNKLFLQDGLERWVWSREDRYGREHRELLFDDGLEKLVSLVFEVAPLDADELPPELPTDSASGDDEAEPSVPFPAKTL